jgi:putative membrane protein
MKGAAMGAANVIPGVSGGTVAFITGIYERLINGLKSFDIAALKLFFQGRFGDFSQKVDLNFLSFLFLGVFVSILSLAKGLELAFEHYEVLTLSFFFGLILASILAVGRQIETYNFSSIVSFIVGAAIAIVIGFLAPTQPNSSFLYLTLCGVAAVSSMILPGLSGSYVLLLMGNYLLVLRAVSSFDFSILTPMFLGCIIGLVVLSRLLSYLFSNFKDQTIGILTGFVAGSLLIIWPWKVTLFQSFDGKSRPIGYIWNLPDLDSQLLISLIFMIAGFAIVFWMEKKSISNESGSGHAL